MKRLSANEDDHRHTGGSWDFAFAIISCSYYSYYYITLHIFDFMLLGLFNNHDVKFSIYNEHSY